MFTNHVCIWYIRGRNIYGTCVTENNSTDHNVVFFFLSRFENMERAQAYGTKKI